MTTPILSIEELTDLVAAVFESRGMAPADARTVAGVVVAAERDGARSHGLQRMPGYVSSMDCGWVNARAEPRIEQRTPGLLAADAGNGLAQIALARARKRLVRLARQNGTALLTIRNAHHFAALWPDVEPFAEAGFIALAMVNSRNLIAAWGGTQKVLGTNPVAFACPRPGAPPLVWDQASSTMSQGDVLLHRAAGKPLPPGTGIDRDGQATTDPAAVLEGALLPFAGAKGSSVAFMVEILTAAFSGGTFGFEDQGAATPGAVTSRSNQFLLLLDPAAAGAAAFGARVEELLAVITAGGSRRLPGERRYAARQRAATAGIPVDAAVLDELRAFCGTGAPRPAP